MKQIQLLFLLLFVVACGHDVIGINDTDHYAGDGTTGSFCDQSELDRCLMEAGEAETSCEEACSETTLCSQSLCEFAGCQRATVEAMQRCFQDAPDCENTTYPFECMLSSGGPLDNLSGCLQQCADDATAYQTCMDAFYAEFDVCLAE